MQQLTQSRNQWFDLAGSSPARLDSIYGTPRGWFKKSLQAPQNIELHDAYIEHSIRAAAVFKRGCNIKHLISAAPWSLLVNWPPKNWTVILVSVADIDAWITAARAAGAVAWFIDDSAKVFEYKSIDWAAREQEFVEDLLVETRGGSRVPRAKYSTDIDHEAIRADLAQGYLTVIEIAHKHNISRTMVYNIRNNSNIGTRPKPKEFDETALMADIVSRKYTRDELAEKYQITMSQMQMFQRKHKLVGFFKRGSPRNK